MRTRSLLTTLAGTFLLAGAGAGTAFASDAAPSSQPTTVPSTPAASAVPSAAPTVPAVGASTPGPVRIAPSTRAPGGQIRVVPSGAPNTGVPATASNGHGEAEAAGAALLVLLGGSGTVLYRRKLKGRG